jgi:hypothetical protein
VCEYQSYSTAKEGPLACSLRFKNAHTLHYHVQAAHTEDGLRKRLKSENLMAAFFDERKIPYDRDFQNVVAHNSCANLRKYFNGTHSRPDFHLFQMQAQASAVVLVGNDEFAHRRYACEADRMIKIASALGACAEFANVPVVYVRFNPHFYEVDGVLFDPPLETRYAQLEQVLESVRTRTLPLKNATGLNVVYMYYPQAGGEPETLQVEDEPNAEFTMVVRACVCANIT